MQLSGSGKGKLEKKKQLSGKKEEGEVSDYRDETWVSTMQRTQGQAGNNVLLLLRNRAVGESPAAGWRGVGQNYH